jgi:hypothetical protein
MARIRPVSELGALAPLLTWEVMVRRSRAAGRAAVMM